MKAEFSALGTTIPWAFALLYIALLVAVSTSFFAAVLYLLDRYHVVTFYAYARGGQPMWGRPMALPPRRGPALRPCGH